MPVPLQASAVQASALPPTVRARQHLRGPGAPEVLASEVDRGEVFVERMDEWRRGWGWAHERFAPYLGLSVPYWRDLRTGRRRLTLTVALRVIQERPEMGAILGDPFRYFAERDRRRGRRPAGGRTPGDRPVLREEAAPEGH